MEVSCHSRRFLPGRLESVKIKKNHTLYDRNVARNGHGFFLFKGS